MTGEQVRGVVDEMQESLAARGITVDLGTLHPVHGVSAHVRLHARALARVVTDN